MSKAALLADLHAEQRQLEALLDHIGAARMDQPGVAGAWSIKDIVAHLNGWRQRTVARFQAALEHQAEPLPPWPAHLRGDDEINDWLYHTNRDRSVSDVLSESRQAFDQLVAVLDAFPDEELLDPQRFPWWGGHPVSAAGLFAHFHDDHEPAMRAWLAQHERPASAG